MSDFEFGTDLAAHAHAIEPSEADLDRLSRRLERPPQRGRRTLPVAMGLVAAAAVMATALWWSQPPGPVDLAIEAGPVALAAGVSGTADGTGAAHIDGSDTHVDWADGRLRLEVTPDAGLSVNVHTDDATVRVVGTAFTVDRGPFGTAVDVERGKVEVVCRGTGTRTLLTAGADAFCLRDVAAGLGRLLVLEGSQAPAAERLLLIDAALAQPGGLHATRTTLLERRVGALAELDRVDEAVSGTASLSTEARRTLLQTAADRALASGDCTTADPWLAALQDDGDAVGALLRVQCLADGQPALAREVLDRMGRWPLTPEQRAATAAWQRSLAER